MSAFKSKGAKRFKDKAVFAHNGKKVVVPVDVDVSETVKRMRAAHEAITEAEKKLRAVPLDDQLQEQYGNAVLNSFAVVLGDGGLRDVLEVYEKDAGDFVRDMKRYVLGRAMPKIVKAEEKSFRRENGNSAWRWKRA